MEGSGLDTLLTSNNLLGEEADWEQQNLDLSFQAGRPKELTVVMGTKKLLSRQRTSPRGFRKLTRFYFSRRPWRHSVKEWYNSRLWIIQENRQSWFILTTGWIIECVRSFQKINVSLGTQFDLQRVNISKFNKWNKSRRNPVSCLQVKTVDHNCQQNIRGGPVHRLHEGGARDSVRGGTALERRLRCRLRSRQRQSLGGLQCLNLHQYSHHHDLFPRLLCPDHHLHQASSFLPTSK